MNGKWLAAMASLSALALASPAGAEPAAEANAAAEAQDARAQTEAALLTMQALSSRLRAMLQRVRRERAPAVGCVNASLTRVDVAWRQGREHARLVAEAWQRDQAEEARFQLRQVIAYRDSARRAADEVDYCFSRK